MSAFTLVELMISIALILILMLGINQVFKVTGEAVGTSQAIATGLRDARSAQAVMSQDLAALATDSPALIIRSERVSAFRNRPDELRDRDFARASSDNAREEAKRTIDIDGRDDDGDGNPEGEDAVPGERIPPAVYNERSHRVDQIRFFGRGVFRRQTGGGPTDGSFIADMTSPEAWIWYGHLERPDLRSPIPGTNQGFEHRPPGKDPDLLANEYNDDNYYASDWVLGRMAILLVEPVDRDGDGDEEIVTRSGQEQFYIERSPTAGTGNLAPLSVNSQCQQTSVPWNVQWSRFDLAGTSISQYQTILKDASVPAIPGDPIPNPNWYNDLTFRFEADPRPFQPLDANSAARTGPSFLEHCSQFIVEFAGDFLTQTPNGTNAGHVTAVGPDGQIDFIVKSAGTQNETRSIRWYGLPRNVDTSDDRGLPMIKGVALGLNPQATQANELLDVVPLRDVILSTGTLTVPPDSFERSFPAPVPLPNYAHPRSGMAPNASTTDPGGGDPHRYIAAWGPDVDSTIYKKPSLIRIVFTIDDPSGRVAEGQTFEYTFRAGG
jgi:prepilin-type N-terminal cleavage/methylation domain-containing protein